METDILVIYEHLCHKYPVSLSSSKVLHPKTRLDFPIVHGSSVLGKFELFYDDVSFAFYAIQEDGKVFAHRHLQTLEEAEKAVSDFMQGNLVTPFGEIHVYIDGFSASYKAVPYVHNIRSLCENPITACYKVEVSAMGGKCIRCVVAVDDIAVCKGGSSDEHFLCAEFAKDNVALTIGAEDDHPGFDTNALENGMEYLCKYPMETVVFGVAWTTDYEGEFDVRTWLAADVF